MNKNPLGLPKGSVRAIITLSFVAIAIILLIYGIISGEVLSFIVVLPVVCLLVGYYFGRRSFS